MTYLGLLLFRFLHLLRLLCLGDSVRSGLGSHLLRLVLLRGDGGQVQTDDAPLMLDGTAGALLGNLFSNTLLVHPAVHLRPCDLARVLALQEERLVFGCSEAEDLCAHGSAVSGDRLNRVIEAVLLSHCGRKDGPLKGRSCNQRKCRSRPSTRHNIRRY